MNQRWLNRDPLGEGGGLNVFGFVGNGPIHRVDPLGLYWFEWGDSWPNYLEPGPNAKSRVGPPPPPPADPEEDLNLLRCSYGGMQIGEDAAHEAAELVGDVGREVIVGTTGVAVGGLIGHLRWIQISRRCPSATRGLATGSDEAVFWSGIGRGGDAKAANWVRQHGGSTLETTMAARGVKLPTWDPNNPATVAAWRRASMDFAAGARGNVRVLQGDSLRVDAIWRDEFKALRLNPNVKSIRAINPESGVEVVIWTR